MAAARRGLPWWFGVGLVMLFIVIVGLVGTLLAGPPPPFVRNVSTQLNVSFSPATWGLLFLTPLLVGFISYVLRWIIDAPASLLARLGASVALVAVVVLIVAGMFIDANGTGSIVVGSSGSGTSGNSGDHGGTGSGGGPGGCNVRPTGSPGNCTTGPGGSSGNGTSGGGNSSGGPNGTKGGSGGTGNGTTGKGGTGNSSGGGGGGGSRGENNSSSSVPGARPTNGASVAVPTWVALAAAGLLAAVVAVLAVPGVVSRLVDRSPVGRRRDEGVIAPSVVRSAFAEAQVAIEAGESPRATILRLYGRLLTEVSGGISDLESYTPEEIQSALFQRFHVPETRSETLTQLFEEARYSTHPIAPPAAERYVQAMREFERDLFLGGSVR